MMAFLNVDLIFKQNVLPHRVAELHRLHDEKDVLFQRAKNENPLFLLWELKTIEYAMQRAWGFELNPVRHTWKYLMPNTPIRPRPGSWASKYLGGLT
jgi:hypothetical protein